MSYDFSFVRCCICINAVGEGTAKFAWLYAPSENFSKNKNIFKKGIDKHKNLW